MCAVVGRQAAHAAYPAQAARWLNLASVPRSACLRLGQVREILTLAAFESAAWCLAVVALYESVVDSFEAYYFIVELKTDHEVVHR